METMITKEKLENLSKDELILYNTLLEQNIKDVAYYACCLKKESKLLNTLLFRKDKENTNLKQKLSRFIGYNIREV